MKLASIAKLFLVFAWREATGFSVPDVLTLFPGTPSPSDLQTGSRINGLPGVPGINGVPGVRGAPGSPGLRGDPGPTGPPGVPGIGGMPGDDGYTGVPGAPGRHGEDGRDGLCGRKGQRGRPGKDGVDGIAGLSGEEGEPGPNGFDGRSGVPGLPGPIGDAGRGALWGQCTWDESSDLDTGVLKTCAFPKESRDTYLKVSFSGNIRIGPCARCCRRWFFTFNDSECAVPAPIDGSIFAPSSTSAGDPIRPGHIEGYCGDIPSGHVRVAFNVGDCAGSGDADAFTGVDGGGSISRIIIQEVAAPIQ